MPVAGIPAVCLRFIHIRMLEQSQAELCLQHLPYGAVESLFRNQTVAASLQERLVLLVGNLKDDIQSAVDGIRSGFGIVVDGMVQLMDDTYRIGIGDCEAVESPFAAQLFEQQPRVSRAGRTVYHIIGSHHRLRAAL